ncbi:hypothetical protein [Paraburkholderia bengalensis]
MKKIIATMITAGLALLSAPNVWAQGNLGIGGQPPVLQMRS